MKFFYKFLYNLIILPILGLLIFIGYFLKNKIRKGINERKNSLSEIRKFFKTNSKPVIWFHVSSAGEYLQARPLIEKLKESKPDHLIYITFFSPTGYHWAKKENQADFISYYPSDDILTVHLLISIIKPKLIIFVKFDLWPNLIWSAHKFKIPILLISATLTPTSLRIKSKIVKSFFKTVYEDIDCILTVSKNDETLFKLSNPHHPKILTTGDTRVDSVLNRQKNVNLKPMNKTMEFIKNHYKNIFIIGSSWPKDEEVLLNTWAKIIKEHPSALMVLTPHEPTTSHLYDISNNLNELHFKYLLLSEFEKNPNQNIDVLLIDRVGILADLYRIGHLAYVGSGVGGVHNTMEPAAWSLPILFGPRYLNAPEAIEFIKLGGAQSIKNSEQLYDYLKKWLLDPEKKVRYGIKNREYLESSSHATDKCLNILSEVLNNGNI